VNKAGVKRLLLASLAFVLIATLSPGFSFGQREHACVLFAMPYLAAAVMRLQGGQSLPKPLAIAVGLLAGIGFAIKPYFLAVPALAKNSVSVDAVQKIVESKK
jgi:hypothetical protein